jgi:hypothetical protein
MGGRPTAGTGHTTMTSCRPLVKLAIAAVLPIALLLGLLLFFQAQERANRNGAVCEGNLATISLLLQNYARIKQHFPPSTLLDSQGKPLHSWRLLVLETAGAPLDSLFQQADLTVPWNHARNKHLTTARARLIPATLPSWALERHFQLVRRQSHQKSPTA